MNTAAVQLASNPEEPSAPSPSNPFVGPVPIDFGQPLHGRNRETEELSDLLVSKRIVLLFSPSGAGKTSLVRAGVVPRLRSKYGIDALPIIRLGHCDPDFVDDATINRYTLATLCALERAREPELRRPPAELARYTLKQYVDEYALAPYIDQAAGKPADQGQTQQCYPMLVFDQFEELFTSDPQGLEVKAQFLTELGDLLRGERTSPWDGDTAMHVWALFVIREDRLAELQPYLDLIPTSLAYRYRLEALSVEAATDAITATAGERWMEPGVAQTLVGDLSTIRVRGPGGREIEQPGRFVEPVQLQVVCRDLWERIVVRRSRSIRAEDVGSIEYSRVDRALRDFIDSEIAAATRTNPAVERSLRTWMESRLISSAGVRIPCLRDADDLDGINKAIDKLILAHLLRLDQRAGRDWIELPHDRLVTPVRESNRAWRKTHLQFFQKRAEQWYETSGEQADKLLLSTNELKLAQAYLATHPHALPPSDAEFLDASTAKRAIQRKQRRWRVLLVLLAAAAVLATVVTVSYIKLAKITEDQTKARGKAYQALTLARERQDVPIRALNDLIVLKDDSESNDVGDDGSLSRAIEDELRQQLARAPAALVRELHPREHLVWSLAFSADGSRLLAGSWDGRVSVQNVEAPEQPEFVTFDLQSEVYAIATHGAQAVSTQADGDVLLWRVDPAYRLRSPRLLTRLPPPRRLMAAVFSEDGRWLAVAGRNKMILLWDFADPDHPLAAPAFGATKSAMQALAFVPTAVGRRLVSTDVEGNVRVWSFDDPVRQTPKLEAEYSIRQHAGHSIGITTVDVDPQGRYIIAGDTEGSVHLWDLRADPDKAGIVLGYLTHRGRGQDTYVGDVDFLGANDFATVGMDGTLVRWTLPSDPTIDLEKFPAETRQTRFRLRERLFSVAHRPGTRAQVAVGGTRAIVLLDLDRGSGPAMAAPLPGQPRVKRWDAVATDADGVSIAARGDRQIHFWRRSAAGIEAVPEWSRVVPGPIAFAWRPDGGQFLTWDACGSLSEWTLHEGKPPVLAAWSIGRDRPPCINLTTLGLVFSPDSRLLATNARSELHLWARDGPAGARWRKLASHRVIDLGPNKFPDYILSLAFSEDGRYLAAGTAGGNVNLWAVSADAGEKRPLKFLRGLHIGQGVSALVFDGVKQQLIAGGIDGFITRCEIPSLRSGSPIPRHDRSITALANAHGAERSVTISADAGGYVVEWSAPPKFPNRISTTDLQERASDEVKTLALNRDGTFLVTAGDSLLAWELATDRIVGAARSYVSRSHDHEPEAVKTAKETARP